GPARYPRLPDTEEKGMRELRTIRWTVDGDGVATLSLNRPEARNAINREMVRELHGALEELGADPRVRVLILRGEGGKAFAAGADIAEMRGRRALDAFLQINARLFQAVEDFPHPVIAAIEGYALGGGCE